MENSSAKNAQFEIHLLISYGIFLLLFFFRSYFRRFPIDYGHGQVTVSTVLLLIFGLYLIFVSSLYFKERVFNSWQENDNRWKINLFKAYLFLFLFCMLLALLYNSGGVDGFKGLVDQLARDTADFLFDDLGAQLGYVGLSIVSPVCFFTFCLSIIALMRAKKQNNSKSFGITLLLLSLLIGAAGMLTFFLMVGFWIQGGIKF